MPEDAATKVCPLCAETIKAAAKICPYCRKAQGRWLFVSRFDVMAITAMIVALAAFVVLAGLLHNGRRFSPTRGEIKILSAQQVTDRSDDQTNSVVDGILTNCSRYAWKTGDFEVRYYDENGKLTNLDFSSDQFTVLAHSEHSFHLVFSEKSFPKFSHYQVFLDSAKDPNAW